MSDRDRERDRDRDRGRDRDRDREGEPGTYSSRPSTSEGSYRAQGPIPLFDQHLRLLADSYISFFTERKRIEEAYIDGLLQLHNKAKVMNTYFDDRTELSTVRRAWREVVEHCDRESQTRQAFLTSLTSDILGPLSAFRETQDRTRKRIREDITSAKQGYDEYAETLSKLKGRYIRRCQEAEELKQIVSPTHGQSGNHNQLHGAGPSRDHRDRHDRHERDRDRDPMSPTDTLPVSASASSTSTGFTGPASYNSAQSGLGQGHRSEHGHNTGGGGNGGNPAVSAPQPLRPLARRASGGGNMVGGGGGNASGANSRARSPSSGPGNALQDLAHQGKRQLNQLMTFLDKRESTRDRERPWDRNRDGDRGDRDRGGDRDGTGGMGGLGSIGSGLGALGGKDPLRGVRAKREADEADKEYRKGVHWLETLRLRRMKILEAGYMSLTAFVGESANLLKTCLTHYTDTVAATAVTQTQLATHLLKNVQAISPVQDAAAPAVRVPRSLAGAVPEPVYYYNYSVGECQDLIWGISLVDYATARGLPEGDIPKVVRICIREVDRRGLEAEGIYRVSGRLAAVQELQRRIEANERAFRFSQSIHPTAAADKDGQSQSQSQPQFQGQGPVSDDVDIFIVSSLLKSYLRELPEPVFRFPLADRLAHTADVAEHRAAGFPLLRAKMRRLPVVHFAVLRAVVEHLARVAGRAAQNRMDVKNLAIVFGPVMFGEDELPKGGQELLAIGSHHDSLMEDMIEFHSVLFDERLVVQGQGQNMTTAPALSNTSTSSLTPVASGQDTDLTPKQEQGSALTSALPALPPVTPDKEIPPPILRTPSGPPPPSSTTSPTKNSSSARGTDDFTPQLPRRPPMSIHPSARGSGLGSPTKSSFADTGSTSSSSGQSGEMPPPPVPPASSKRSSVQFQLPGQLPVQQTTSQTQNQNQSQAQGDPGANPNVRIPPPSPRQRVTALPPSPLAPPPGSEFGVLQTPSNMPIRQPTEPPPPPPGALNSPTFESSPETSRLATIAVVASGPGRMTPAEARFEGVEAVSLPSGDSSDTQRPERLERLMFSGAEPTDNMASTRSTQEKDSGVRSRTVIPPPVPIDLPTPPGDQAYVSVPFPSVGSPAKPQQPTIQRRSMEKREAR